MSNNWRASNYRQRKAERFALIKPEWIINPVTGEQFYLRKVGGLMSSVLAGYMPSGLTAVAVEAWKEKGVEGLKPENLAEFANTLTTEQREAIERETATLSKIIREMCVIPLLSNQLPSEIEFTDEWRAAAIRGLKEKDPHFDEATFDPADLVLDSQDLDEDDVVFLFQWAKGLAGGVALKGGNVVSTANFSALRKEPARGIRTGSNESEILQSTG